MRPFLVLGPESLGSVHVALFAPVRLLRICYHSHMSSRAYIRIERLPSEQAPAPDMALYHLLATVDADLEDEFEFVGPDDLLVGNSFPDIARAQMWVAHALSEDALNTDDSINALLPLGRVSLEVGLESDIGSRGGGQRVVWKSSQSLAQLGAHCLQRDLQNQLGKRLAPAAPKTSRNRM